MAKFSVRKPLTVFVVVLAIIIVGIVAFTKMTPDLLPNMDFPYVVIMTTYAGASPETVEEEVTRPLEESMSTLEHIDTVSSTSAENYSLVILEFEDDVNMDTIGVDIQQNIATLSGTWDDAVGTPYVLKINPSVLPVETAAVSMEGMDIVELTDFVENTLTPQLEGVTGVASITTMGGVTSQVHVIIDQDKIDDVNERLAAAVNEQIDDARADLEETQAELEDAQAELDEAQAELDSGSATLTDQTAAADAEITEQTISLLQTRMDIQEQILSLTETKAQLETSLESIQPMSEQIAELEAASAALQQNIDAIQAAADTLTSADAGLQVYTDQIAAIEADETLTDEEKAGQTAAIQNSDEYINAQAAVTAAESALTALGTDRYSYTAAIATAQASIAGNDAALSAMDTSLASMGLTRDTLGDSIAEMESGLAECESAIELLNTTLQQLDDGTIQLSEAAETLSSTKSEGLLQIAEASSQLAVNAAAVDSAMDQVESGLDSIEDSREEALQNADITDKITMDTVTSILQAQDFSMPAGYVEEDGIDYMVSVGDSIEDVDELENMLLFDTGEDGIGPIYLSDVAEIFVTDNSDETYAKLNGSDGVILSFEKQSNVATADASDNINERFEELEAEYPGLHFVSLMDQGSYIYLIVQSILQSLLTGALFAVIVLFLFLRDWRPTLITVVSIPVSVVFAVVLMYFSGVTLNMISLSGLSVAVGMLVDNSIVVIENIYRLRSKGATAVQAAVQGTKQVAGAIIASTLTTVCVFLPIVFVEGITRQLFTDLALTMGYALVASLLIALTLVPAMSRGMLRDRKKKKEKPEKKHRLAGVYRGSIRWALRHKWIVLPLAALLLFGSAAAALSKGFSYMPDTDSNTISATLTMPEDATREEAVAVADEFMTRALALDNVEDVGLMMGGTSILSTSTTYDVTAYITLTEGSSGLEEGQQLVEECADLDCEVSCDSAMMSMSSLTGSGITVYIYGNDMESLQEGAAQTAEVLQGVEGVADVEDGLEDSEPALHVSIDKNAAMAKGYTVAQLYMDIASELSTSSTALDMDINGVTADVLVESGDTVTKDELCGMTFEYTDSDNETAEFRLDEVADIESTVSLATISRENQQRYISVTATLEDGYNVTKVTASAKDAMAAAQLPDGDTYKFDGENETIMEAVRQLALMLLLGLVLVYFIMVAQFQSLKSPFIVMFTIPLAFTGGFLALLICGMDVSIISLIGFVMLMGIIVNNGIVLVDYVNQLRAAGMERREALVEASATRLRPILMTSLTTILGLIVMALGQSVGTSLMQPVAVVCIGGLLYATLMTLYVVPCIYDLFNRREITVLKDEDMEFDEL